MTLMTNPITEREIDGKREPGSGDNTERAAHSNSGTRQQNMINIKLSDLKKSDSLLEKGSMTS